MHRLREPLVIKWYSAGSRFRGIVIAVHSHMPIAKKLVNEIEDFASRNPGHHKSVNALLKAVRRIDTRFSGETRNMLLVQARETFLRQINTLEKNERTLEALETLQANQKELVKALKKLKQYTVARPEGATLH
jgi:hypothetical protein